MTEEQWNQVEEIFHKKKNLLNAAMVDLNLLRHGLLIQDLTVMETSLEKRLQWAKQLAMVEKSFDQLLRFSDEETKQYLDDIVLGKNLEHEDEVLLHDLLQDVRSLQRTYSDLELDLLRRYEEQGQKITKVTNEMTDKDIVDMHVLLRKKYNLLTEVKECSKQIGTHLDRKDEASIGKSISERQGPLEKLEALQGEITKKLATYSESDYKRFVSILEGEAGVTTREKALAKQVSENRALLKEVLDFDERVNKRLAGMSSVYHTSKV